MVFKKGDLVAGVEMESDCIGVVVSVRNWAAADVARDATSDRIVVRWLHHWHSEMVDGEFSYLPWEMRPLNVESEEG